MSTYKYSGKSQSVSIGQSGTYDITAYGGQGGAGGDSSGGGLGAEEGGAFQLTAGEKLKIIVGGAGGAGGNAYSGGGGGGATAILANTGINGAYVPLLVAGGGGGGYHYSGGAGLTTGSGNGNGGAAGNSGYYGNGGAAAGAGGAGVNSNGTSAATNFSGGAGGSNNTGNYSGGAGYASAGSGGFGGGGGGGNNGGGGGGGGGFTGGNGGYYNVSNSDNSASTGGTSYSTGTPIASMIADGVNSGAGKANLAFVSPVCFASGTLVRTTRGDVPVEELIVGDVVITFFGHHRRIRWLGHRTISFKNHPNLSAALPVRIAAHALGHSCPARDLLVSPGHSICLDILGKVLIPASALINGSTITQPSVDHVTYWHVELDTHDILIAENLPAESYLEMGNRGFFVENNVTNITAGPDKAERSHSRFCLPYHPNGHLVDIARNRLQARAEALSLEQLQTRQTLL